MATECYTYTAIEGLTYSGRTSKLLKEMARVENERFKCNYRADLVFLSAMDLSAIADFYFRVAPDKRKELEGKKEKLTFQLSSHVKVHFWSLNNWDYSTELCGALGATGTTHLFIDFADIQTIRPDSEELLTNIIKFCNERQIEVFVTRAK